MAEIDRLSIKLTADASSAKRSVNSLVKALETLNKALGSLDVGNLNNFNHVVGQLANSVSALSSATAGIRETAKAFNELGKSASSVKKAKDATQELANTSTSLMVVSNAITDVAVVSNSLTNVFGKIQSSFASISGGTQRLIGDMGTIRSSFLDAVEPINQLTVRLQTLMEGFREFVTVIYSISGSNQKLIEDTGIIDGTFREIVEPINGAGNALQAYSQKQNEVSQTSQVLVDNLKKVQEAQLEEAPSQGMDKQAQSTQNANNELKALRAGYEAFLSVIRRVGSAFVVVSKRVFSATTSFHGFRKAAEKAISNIPKATDLAKKFGKEITRIGKMLKLMVTRMALRAVIKEIGNGFKSLALHSDEFNNSVSGIMNGAKQLGYSFASMVSPLINAVAPAIVYVINLLIKLANAINQVVAALTGASSWNKAKEFTDDWRKSIEDANKDAKELKKTVLGFDEINQMQAKQTGGDTSNNIIDMFDTEKIDPKWKNIADWFKKMWELGDFTELGAKLGKKLRDALESIPWNQIRKTANKLGGALATLINGFVEVERLGYDIGKTIAQSVNTVFEFLNGFVHKLHWDSIGKFIADVFNGFFKEIDWPLIKDTVVTGMAGIAEAIQTFINEFDWDNISDFIIHAVDVIVSGIKAFFKGIDWHDLGQKMGDQIRKSVLGIDWKEVGEALGTIIQSAIDWVAGMLETMPSAQELVQAATDFLDGIFGEVDSEKLGEEIATIFNGIYNFLVGFWEENGDKIKEEVKKFFEGFWNKVDKKALKEVISTILSFAILGGIGAIAWVTLKKYLATKMTSLILSTQVKKAVADAMGGLSTAPTVTAAAEKAGEVTFSWFQKGMIGTAKALDIVKSIKDIFKFNELKSDLDEGKISWKEYWDSVYDAGGLTQQNAAFSALDDLVAVSKLFPDEIARLNEEVQNGTITVEQYEEAISKLAPAANDYKDRLDEIIRAHTEGVIPTTQEFKEKCKELKDEFKDQDKVSRDYVEGLKKAASAVKTSTEAVDKNKESSKKGTEQTRKYVDAKRDAVKKFEELTTAANTATDSTGKTDTSLDKLKKSTDKASEGVKGLAGSMSKDFGTSSDDMKKAAKEMEEELSKSFSGIFDSSKEITEEMPADFSKGVDDIIKSEGDLNKTSADTMSDIVKLVDDGTKDITKDFDTIKDAMTKEKWTFQGVADGLGETFRKAKEAIKKEWNEIAETLNGEHELGGSKMKIDLPKFAMGGFPRENGVFMANSSELVGRFDNGRTAVANNEQIIAGISQGVYNAVTAAMSRNANNGNAGYIANTIVVDGDVIARTVTKAQQKQNMRYSPVMG